MCEQTRESSSLKKGGVTPLSSYMRLGLVGGRRGGRLAADESWGECLKEVGPGHILSYKTVQRPNTFLSTPLFTANPLALIWWDFFSNSEN